MILLGYSLDIDFYRNDIAFNKYYAQAVTRGMYAITSYNWELTNVDTATVVDTSIATDWSYEFTQEANYELKLTVQDSVLGAVEQTKAFQITNLNSNYYVVNMTVNIDGNVTTRKSNLPYFMRGSTPSLLLNLVNYNYEDKEYEPLNTEDLDFYIRIKTLEEEQLDTPDYELSYLTEYNSVDHPLVVEKVLPYTSGVLKVTLDSQDTDVEGELVVQVKVVDNGTVIKTTIERLMSKDSL